MDGQLPQKVGCLPYARTALYELYDTIKQSLPYAIRKQLSIPIRVL